MPRLANNRSPGQDHQRRRRADSSRHKNRPVVRQQPAYNLSTPQVYTSWSIIASGCSAAIAAQICLILDIVPPIPGAPKTLWLTTVKAIVSPEIEPDVSHYKAKKPPKKNEPPQRMLRGLRGWVTGWSLSR